MPTRSRTLAGRTRLSGGTQIIAGPNCAGELSTGDFDNSFATLISLGANFGPNGVSGGMVMFSSQPLISPSDLLFVKAFGFIAGVGLATSIDVELCTQVFHCRVGA